MPLLSIYSVDGLTFRGNQVENTRDYPAPDGKPARLFEIVDSDHVTLDEPTTVVAKQSTTSAN